MASDAEFLDYACGQIRNIPGLSHRRMFGEYAVYVGDKVVAFICDNQFFLKPTEGNRALLGTPVERPIFPGSKNYYMIDDQLDDPEMMTQLIRVTERDLPKPKAKKPRAAKSPAAKKVAPAKNAGAKKGRA